MGAVVKLEHTHLYAGKWRWIPPPWARNLGAVAETLTEDTELSDEAITRSRRLTRWWTDLREEKATLVERGSVVWLIQEYQRSAWYRELGRRTIEEVGHALTIIEQALGDMPVAKIERKHIRKFHNGAITKWSRHKANRLVKWLRRLLNYAIELGELTDNPALNMGLRHNRPRRIRWTSNEVEAIKSAALKIDHRPLALTVQLGYDTSQRLGDIQALRWNQFDGEGLTFLQGKTGAEVWVPLSTESLRMLAETPRTGVQIIVSNRTGRPYTDRLALNRAFRKAKQVAGIRSELQFRDLRRTAASEVIAGGGRAEPITGHRPGSNALRVYEVPDRQAARESQAARQKREQKSK